jgi:hypothetical protein
MLVDFHDIGGVCHWFNNVIMGAWILNEQDTRHGGFQSGFSMPVNSKN